MLAPPFVDSDQEIESASRMTIQDMFERYGEAEFRALEQRVILRVLENGPQVLSTGGGAFMNAQTREAIAAPWRFGVAEGRTRPAVRAGLEEAEPAAAEDADPRAVLERLMEERYPVYATADVTVPTRDDARKSSPPRCWTHCADFSASMRSPAQARCES